MPYGISLMVAKKRVPLRTNKGMKYLEFKTKAQATKKVNEIKGRSAINYAKPRVFKIKKGDTGNLFAKKK